MKRVYEDEGMQEAYEQGLDSGLNGANTTNCHFRLFSSPDKTRAWERGNHAGKIKKGKGLLQVKKR